jgi:hypothetical protein
MIMALGDYVNGLTALTISGAAAALSSTVIKSELLPEQLNWLGAAGTVVAACMIVVGFSMRPRLKSGWFKLPLVVAVIITCVCLIWLRAARVSEVELGGKLHNYLPGETLTKYGLDAQGKCGFGTAEQLIQCAGVGAIPLLYESYWCLHYLYVFDYLLLVASFVALVSEIELRTFGP